MRGRYSSLEERWTIDDNYFSGDIPQYAIENHVLESELWENRYYLSGEVCLFSFTT